MKLRPSHVLYGTIIGVVLRIFRPDLRIHAILFVSFIAITLFFLLGNYESLKEGFSVADSGSDDSRMVRYGDSVCLWTLQSNFLKVGTNGLQLSDTLTRPEDVPRGSYKHLFTIEDPNDPAGPGNNNPLTYGSTIYLRSLTDQYIMATDNNTVTLQTTRDDGHNVFTVEGDSLQTSTIVAHGDGIYLKNTNSNTSGVYITINTDNTMSMLAKAGSSRLQIQDRFGQGLTVNWARRGQVSQSSTSQNLSAVYAVDGKLTTFSSTNSESNPWWKVALPKQVYVDSIVVRNRTGVTDDIKMKLSNFSIIITDAYNIELSRKDITTSTPTDEFTWSNVYVIGRVVKIQLNDTTAQTLSVADISVMGLPVNQSILLNRPLISDLTTYEPNNSFLLDDARGKTYENQELPSMKYDGTIAFWIKVSSTTYKDTKNYKNILMKGSGTQSQTLGSKAPGVWLSPGTPNLCIYQTSLQTVNDGIATSTLALTLDKPVHIAIAVTAGCTPSTGWQVGTFTPNGQSVSKFVIFNSMQKRYYQLTNITPTNYTTYFGNVTVISIDDLDAKGFQDLGTFVDTDRFPRLTLYMDGRVSDSVQLKDLPQFNSSPLNFNVGNITYATVSNLVVSNYLMTQQQIFTLASSKATDLCKTLISKTVDASQPVVYAHSELPTYNQAMTLSFWMQTTVTPTAAKTPVVVKGTIDVPELGIILLGNGVNFWAPVRTTAYPKMEGVQQSSKAISTEWAHICVAVANSAVTVYVNGQQSDSSALSQPLSSSNADLTIGGFIGYIQNCKFCNYGIAVDELPMLMGSHPDTALNSQLQGMFEQVGCSGYPYGIDKDPGAAVSYKSLLLNNEADQITHDFTTMKQNADKYLNGDPSADNKLAAEMCYGNTAFISQVQQATTQNNGPHAACLPTAPFSCPSTPDINSFDIRTHQDFYKYVNASNVIPTGSDPASYVKISDLASSPAMVTDILKQNPRLAQLIAADLAADPTLANSSAAIAKVQSAAGQLPSLSGTLTSATPSAIAKALQSDPQLASQVMADVVQSTGNDGLVKQIAQALLINNQLALQDLVKQLSMTDLMTTVKSMLSAQNVPTSQIISTLASDSQLKAALQEMISSGKLSATDVLNSLSDSQDLRDTVSTSCTRPTDFSKFIPRMTTCKKIMT